jgi:hypothetical protein
VGRQGHGRDDGPGGKPVFRTTAPVPQPVPPCDDEEDCRRLETGGIKEAKPPWERGYPSPQHERAVRVPVVFTLLRCALATADRRPCEREAMGGEPVGWQRWRRQLLEQTRDKVIVSAHGPDGIVHLAEYSLLLGVQLKDVPPDIGSRQQVLAKYRLSAPG